MGKDEVEHIREEIERSGFPLEIEIASTLKNSGWEVLYSPSYFDLDEEKWREMDIKAYKSFDCTSTGESIKPYRLKLALIIECKKSEEFSWIFFPWQREDREIDRSMADFLDFITVTKRQSILKEEGISSQAELQMLNMDVSLLSEESAIDAQTARKLNFFSELGVLTSKSFRFLTNKTKALHGKEIKIKKKSKNKSSDSNQIFKAVSAVIKATKYDLSLCSYPVYVHVLSAKRGFGVPVFEVMVFIPVILFDGKLYVWIDGNVSQTEEILFEGRCQTKHYFESMLISILQKDRFERFLAEISEDAKTLADQIYRNRNKLDEQKKIIMEAPFPRLVSKYGL